MSDEPECRLTEESGKRRSGGGSGIGAHMEQDEMPSREDMVALLNKVFDIASAANPDEEDEGGESIPMPSSRLKRMRSLKMSEGRKEGRKNSLGSTYNSGKFSEEEEASLLAPESMRSAENKLHYFFGDNLTEIFTLQEKAKDDKKRVRGRSMLRMPSTLRKDSLSKGSGLAASNPSPSGSPPSTPSTSPGTTPPTTPSSSPPVPSLLISAALKSTAEERASVRVKLAKVLNLSEKELLEYLRFAIENPPPSPKKKTTALSGSLPSKPKHRRSTSAGPSTELGRKAVTKKFKQDEDIEFESLMYEYPNLVKFHIAFGKYGVMEVVNTLNEIHLTDVDKLRSTSSEELSPGRREKKKGKEDPATVKDKLGQFLLHRPTQQDLKAGGILPSEDSMMTESSGSVEGVQGAPAVRKRSLFGRQDSKAAILGPSSSATSSLTNKSLRDKQNWDYLGKRLPDSYPVVKPNYITDPDSFEYNPTFPPLLLPVFGYRLELGTSMPVETKAHLFENLYLEDTERDIRYYRDNFVSIDHVNYLGFDPTLGAVAVSIELPGKDRMDMCKAIIRTKKGVERAIIPGIVGPKGLLKAVVTEKPMLAHTKFVRVKDPQLVQDLLEFEEKLIVKRYKIGVLYVKDGQDEENDMFGNIDGSEAFEEFLDFLGDRIPLKGWKGYRGGLDVSKNSTGTHSVHTTYRGYDVMFHVSTLLPWSADEPQQLERKRHLGNDIVVMVFVDGKSPFPPDVIKSEFNHCFIVVQLHSREPVETQGKDSDSAKEETVMQERQHTKELPMKVVSKEGRRSTDPPEAEKEVKKEIASLEKRNSMPDLKDSSGKLKIKRNSSDSSVKETNKEKRSSSNPLEASSKQDTESESSDTDGTSKEKVATTKTFYKVSCGDKIGVESYGPFLPEPPIFEKNEQFREYFLTKALNAERAALHSPDFKGKLQRTQLLMLKDIVEKYVKKKDLTEMNFG